MIDLQTEIEATGIKLGTYAPARYKTRCPRCTTAQTDSEAKPLKIKITDSNLAEWNCESCFWEGTAGDVTKADVPPINAYENEEPEPVGYVPEVHNDRVQFLIDITEHFTKKVKLTLPVMKKNRITFREDMQAICVPYYANGDLVAVKFLAEDGREQFDVKERRVFFGFDDVKNPADLIITNNELAKMSLEVCGLNNVIAMPPGAPGKYEFLVHADEMLHQAKRVILALHSDVNQTERAELIRRIGIAKCFVVEWPEGCGDANGSLRSVGIDVTLECVSNASPCPISGLYSVMDFESTLTEYFENGMRAGVPTGFENLDRLYSVMPGELTVVTGVPNSGKSEFIDALMINLSKYNHWRFALFSPENSKEQHVAKLVEKVVGAPVSPSAASRMDVDAFLNGAAWVNGYFYFIVADDLEALPTLEWILDKAHAAVFRYGIKGLVIDPYNEIEHNIPNGMNETMYVSKLLSQIKRFARAHAIHIWVIAHPTKMKADKDGKMQVPSLYDISGSANWVNKTDNGIVVFRSEDAADQTEIHVKKIRFKHVGRRGMCHLNYDKDTGRYTPPKTDKELGVPEGDMNTWDPPA